MKIIEGKLAGQIINYQEKKGTRVTSERVRKAVFDVLKGIIGSPSAPLGTKLSGLKVCDLFCGSGLYGIEALSRGAENCVFVDSSKGVVKELKKNIEILNIKYSILNIGFEKFLQNCDEKFDLVFADPPYYEFDLEKFNEIYKILEKEGVFVLECSKRIETPDFLNLEKISEKQYGDTKIAIFRNSK